MEAEAPEEPPKASGAADAVPAPKKKGRPKGAKDTVKRKIKIKVEPIEAPKEAETKPRQPEVIKQQPTEFSPESATEPETPSPRTIRNYHSMELRKIKDFERSQRVTRQHDRLATKGTMAWIY